MVYGALPPESRRSQATLFNTPGSGVQVLVASDAVGMGLNLNIKRVVFATMRKFDGEGMRELQPREVKQIAGRAGRFSSDHPEGFVACLDQGDVAALKRSLVTPNPKIKEACLLPR
jgi:ATP-dependent RNA helicase SUPV3L1/SUV3